MPPFAVINPADVIVPDTVALVLVVQVYVLIEPKLPIPLLHSKYMLAV